MSEYDETEKERMNPVVKAEWLKRLRSGEYSRSEGCLKGLEGGFCCLGVLTDIWAAETGTEWFMSYGGTTWSIGTGGESAVTPVSVMEWSNLKNSTGTLLLGDYVKASGRREFYVTLSNLNDEGMTFEEIADVIDYAL